MQYCVKNIQTNFTEIQLLFTYMYKKNFVSFYGNKYIRAFKFHKTDVLYM